MTSTREQLNKAFGMPNADTSHQYIYKSGEYGSMYQYWYRDTAGNYYRYTNAPEDTPDYDPLVGLPLMDPEQPLPEKNPEFFSPEGYKLAIAIPQGAKPNRNPSYNQNDPRNLWLEVVMDGDKPSYIYLDADVKENLDLYVQHQIRVVDAALPKLRQFATELFAGKHVKDRLTGAIIMLVEQGFFEVEELVAATVGDVQFIDQAVMLLGRKFVCDLTFFDFLTSLIAQRSPQEPLFQLDTVHGKTPIGKNYLYSVFASVRCSPKFLLSWNASHLFSRIMNRMSFQQIPAEEVETQAFDELARTLGTRDDVKYLVDYKVRVALMRTYGQGMMKGIQHLTSDDFGVAIIRSDLKSLRPDEKEFSDWLHTEPMHDTSPAEEQQVADALGQQQGDENQVQQRPESEQGGAQGAGADTSPKQEFGGGSPDDKKEAPATPPGDVPT